MKNNILLILLLLTQFSFAQQQDKNWYFGNGTDGIIFNGLNVPAKVSNKFPGVGFEGMAVANDPCSGELLFYTDGIKVIDKTHSLMFNGNGLLANLSGSQCVQICKFPGSCNKYYVISNSSWDNTPGSFYYSIVDFSSNPLGEVTIKNQLLNGPDYHQAMRIIPKTNSNNYWLIGHLYNTATYHVFEVTPAGFVGPVVYNFSNSGRSWAMEYCQATHKLVNMGQDNLKVSLFDFDPSTGVISNEQQLYTGALGAWVGNFSPDGSKIYAGLGAAVTDLWQYDFNNGLWTNMSTCCWAHDVKTGPDGIMYFIHSFNDVNPLSKIVNPNLSAIGNACGYSTITNPGNFNGEVRRFPEFLQLPDPPIASLDTTSVTGGSSIVISPLLNDTDPQGDILSLTSIVSGPSIGTATINGNQISYTSVTSNCNQTDTIVYSIEDNTCMCDTAMIIIRIIGSGNLNMQITSTPGVQCFGSHDGSASVIASGVPPLQYVWTLPDTTTLTTSTISNLSGGNYSLTVTDSIGCTATRNFTITEPALLTIDATGISAGCGALTGSATSVPAGGTIPYSYQWNTSPVQTTQNASNLFTGNYTVTLTDDHNCTATDSVTINNLQPQIFEIIATPATCLAMDGSVSVTHVGGVGPFSYHWSTSPDTTVSQLTGLPTGGYSVFVIDLSTGCSQSLSTVVPNAAGIVATITSFTDATCQTSEDGSATVAGSGGQTPYSYLWPNGDTTATTVHLGPGTYLARVEDYNGCRSYASVTIGYDNVSPIIELGPDTMPCVGTPFTMDAGAGFTSYLWSDNSTNQTLTVSLSGFYSVLVTNSLGCQSFDVVNVSFVTCFVLSTNDISNGTTIKLYPNPAGDNLTIDMGQLHISGAAITITDILGKKLFFRNEKIEAGNKINIDLHAFSQGIYLVKIEHDGEMETVRFVKE